jgi:hypothetical protein
VDREGGRGVLAQVLVRVLGLVQVQDVEVQDIEVQDVEVQDVEVQDVRFQREGGPGFVGPRAETSRRSRIYGI